MLTQLCIDNFALAKNLALDFEPGMTAITGETGAGKSLTLDALTAITGGRADSKMIRNGCQQADIHAQFDLADSPAAKQWLQEHDLDDQSDCMLRRILNRNGRTKSYINGKPVTAGQLKALGELLVDIHSQNQHYSLLKRDTQRDIIDNFADHHATLETLGNIYQATQDCQRHLAQHLDNADEQSAREQLLSYQVEELTQLDIGDDELQTLEQEQSQLANAEALLTACYHSQQLCDNGDGGILDVIQQAVSSLINVGDDSEGLKEAIELLTSAQIHVSEASIAIADHIERQTLDPARLQWVEERLSTIYQTARKHRIQPHELPELSRTLSEELALLSSDENQIDRLQQQIEQLNKQYDKTAQKITRQRKAAAKKLQQQTNRQLNDLGMKHCNIEFSLTPCDRSASGKEIIELLVSTNPGHPPQPIAKIASGGELSRISLALSVATTNQRCASTLIFDEVDVGIGGSVAEIIGRLLRELGQNCQVFCITHLPQVASQAHQHLQAKKNTDKQAATSHISSLDNAEKVEEIARMLGGIDITQQTRAHAREMLSLNLA